MRNLSKLSAILIIVLLSTLSSAHASSGKEYNILSPDGKINVYIYAGHTISWAATYEGTNVIESSDISLTLGTGEVLGKNVKVSKNIKTSVNETLTSPFYKKSEVIDNYNSLNLVFKGNYGVEFRAYNDGVAYRFYTNRKEDLTIVNEEAQFNFDNDYKAFVPYINDMRSGERYTFSFESYYDEIKFSQMQPDSLSINPLLVDLGNKKKVVILESDVEDYPGMFLVVNENKKGVKAAFAPYPLEGKYAGYSNINFIATKRADYIAKTNGDRTFPWRAVVISGQDKDLANSDMAYKLASPSRISDISWIKPGKVAWDWWNDWNISHVDFKAGINTETYKHYIDFASANNLEYIIMDAGWTVGNNIETSADKTNTSLMNVVPSINLPELIAYGKSKNVDIILWASWMLADKEKDIVFPHYAQMGIKGFKVDFLDSDDQKMMQSAFAIAKAAADNHILLDLHGFRATGLSRTYPNVVNFEGVKGLENMKWASVVRGRIKDDQPRYDVTIPYIRMMAGPMDYTPGAMRNANMSNFSASNSEPMSQGTRVHQMAMYTIYEAPLQMLADNPTAYMKEQECTDFIAKVPTVFDQTVALDGEVGEYVAIARRKDNTWYVGAMTNWTPRDIVIDLSFLGEGTYTAEIFKDGVNSDRQATDYKKEVIKVTAKDKLTAKMFPAGGWTARIQ